MIRSAVVVCVVAAAGASQGDLISISFPESVTLSQATAQNGPRSVNAPFDFSGIGNIVNPTFNAPGTGSIPSDFTLHQTVGVVDLADVVVTYEYDEAVLVDAFDVVQHGNGVRTFEVLVGDSLAAMTSIGTASMAENRIEWALFRFEYDTAIAGRFVQLRVVEPELAGQGGWAFYRAFPVVDPVPGPGAGAMALGMAALGRRRR